MTERGVEAIWEMSSIAPFNELIVSFNAMRPKLGKYRISVSVNEQAGWTKWLTLVEWGADGQKTFNSKSSATGAYTFQDIVHLGENQTADGFRVKVEGFSQANLEQFDMLFASVSNLKQFDMVFPGPLEAIKLPLQSLRSQIALRHPRHFDLCSPTASCMAIDFLLQKRIADPIDFAAKVLDHGFNIYGNWILNVAESYHRLRGCFECSVERLPDFTALHSKLMRNLPVIVSVKGPLPRAKFPFDQGHLMLVYGYDSIEKRVFCADPAHATDAETATYYNLNDFLAAWARRKNLCYLFQPSIKYLS